MLDYRNIHFDESGFGEVKYLHELYFDEVPFDNNNQINDFEDYNSYKLIVSKLDSICKKYNIKRGGKILYTERTNLENLSNAQRELSDEFYVSPVIWMPLIDEVDIEPVLKTNIYGFVVDFNKVTTADIQNDLNASTVIEKFCSEIGGFQHNKEEHMVFTESIDSLRKILKLIKNKISYINNYLFVDSDEIKYIHYFSYSERCLTKECGLSLFDYNYEIFEN